MNKTLLKAGSGVGIYGISVGGSITWINLISKLWQKRELTEEFMEAHPVLGGMRVALRVISLLIGPVIFVYGVASYITTNVWDLIEKKFPDKNEEEK